MEAVFSIDGSVRGHSLARQWHADVSKDMDSGHLGEGHFSRIIEEAQSRRHLNSLLWESAPQRPSSFDPNETMLL